MFQTHELIIVKVKILFLRIESWSLQFCLLLSFCLLCTLDSVDKILSQKQTLNHNIDPFYRPEKERSIGLPHNLWTGEILCQPVLYWGILWRRKWLFCQQLNIYVLQMIPKLLSDQNEYVSSINDVMYVRILWYFYDYPLSHFNILSSLNPWS